MPAVLLDRAPTNSLAKVLDVGYLPSWGILAADDLEDNEKLVFPESIISYNKMMNTDAQCQGLAHGSTWPLYRMRWWLEPGEARADGVERISRDLALPIGDDDLPRRRTRNRFKFGEFLEEALDAIFLGFKVFEQNVEEGPDGFLHYRKLLNIPPTSIAEIKREDDGGIAWIKQHGHEAPELLINRLVWYAFQRRGANWTGKSLLRGCYGPWLLKDRAMRVGVMNIQRAGVGTPVIEAHPGATEGELIVLNRLAERFKAGERSGGAVPAGARLKLVGVEGSQPDSVGFIKLMNEEMARAFLQMFMQLGQTGSGSRALGEQFIDWHKLTLEYIATWFATIFTEHVIEDDWDWNYGEDEDAVPSLQWSWDEEGDEGAEAAEQPNQDLVRRIEEGELEVDEEVAAAIGAVPGRLARSSMRRHAGRRRRGGKATRAAGASPTAAPPLPLPGRSLRRQLYDHEIAAAVDYDAIDTSFNSALELLIQEVRTLQGYQIAELHDAIVEAGGDLSKLGALSATPEHRDVILQRLRAVADLAAEQHVGEARRQGRTDIARPDTETLAASLMNRADALDNILTTDLSTSAAREAVRLSGGSLSSAEVADDVRQSLIGRSTAYLRDLLGGAVQQAINAGRGLVIRRADPERIYASELLDTATCVNCVAKDGTQYQTMDDAERDYPSGGFKDCLGRERCRGFLVAVYQETDLPEPFGGGA